jgi:NitT/TauT family transport system substrate-binding protein
MRGVGRLVALLLALVACGPAQSPARLPPVTLRVGAVPFTQWAPLYVALDRGYFDQLNVRVQLVPVRLGQDPVDLLARGQLDVLLTDLDVRVFNGLAAGLRFKVAGSMARLPEAGAMPFALEVGTPLTELKGGKIAIEGGPGSARAYLADRMLRTAGLGLKDLTVIDLSAASTEVALAGHGVDAALVPAPFSTAIEGHGVAVPQGALPPGAAWDGLLLSDGLTTSAGQAFIDGLIRGVRDLVGRARTSDRTLAILARHTGISERVLSTMPPYDWDVGLRPRSLPLADLQATFRAEGLLTYGSYLPAEGIVRRGQGA